MRLIETDLDVAAGIKALRRKCDVVRKMHDAAGDPPLRRNAGGFAALARIIIGQQVSVASANAIWTAFSATVEPMTTARLDALDDAALTGAGLSRPKVRTLRAVAKATTEGLDLARIGAMDDDAARAALTAVSGIGPWTADVYLMFCVGRPDIFAAGDLALQEAARMAFDLDARPDAATLTQLAERWRPWRAVAARLLWHYYAHVKTRAGQPV